MQIVCSFDMAKSISPYENGMFSVFCNDQEFNRKNTHNKNMNYLSSTISPDDGNSFVVLSIQYSIGVFGIYPLHNTFMSLFH